MKKAIKKWAAPLLCGLFTLILFKFVLFVGYVPSASMEPTIKAESLILGCRLMGALQRGDIVMFCQDGYYLVKRIAAVPGDVIYIEDTREAFSVNEDPAGATRVLIVPDGSYYMLGDNEEKSIDSRYWDEPFVEQSQVVAKVLCH